MAVRVMSPSILIGLDELGDAKVEQLGRAVARHQNVSRLDVAMNHQALVRVLDRLGDDTEQPQTLANRQAPRRTVDVDRVTFDVFHDDVRRAGCRGSGIEQVRDVRMIQRGEDAALCMKALHDLGMDQVARHYLDRDQFLEALIVARGEVDDAHAAAAQLAEDAIGAESRGRRIGSGEAPGRIQHHSRGLGRVQHGMLEKRACLIVRQDQRFELGAKRRVSSAGALDPAVTGVRRQIDGFGEQVFQPSPAGELPSPARASIGRRIAQFSGASAVSNRSPAAAATRCRSLAGGLSAPRSPQLLDAPCDARAPGLRVGRRQSCTGVTHGASGASH